MFRGMLLVVALAVTALAMAACGGDDDDDDGNGGGATATQDDGDDGENGGGDATVSIEIQGFSFSPSEFTVPAGEDVTIAVSNPEAVPHTFTVYLDEAYTEMQGTTLPLDGGAEDTISGTFDAGTYYFRCEIHPATMTGSFTAE